MDPNRDLTAQQGNPSYEINQRRAEMDAIQDPEELFLWVKGILDKYVGHGLSPANYKKWLLHLQQAKRYGMMGLQKVIWGKLLTSMDRNLRAMEAVDVIASVISEDTHHVTLTEPDLALLEGLTPNFGSQGAHSDKPCGMCGNPMDDDSLRRGLEICTECRGSALGKRAKMESVDRSWHYNRRRRLG